MLTLAELRVLHGRPQPGDVCYDPKNDRDRTFVRRALVGTFTDAAIWGVEDAVAHAASPVPWDTSRRWPWVVNVDVDVPCRDGGRLLKVTFTMPSLGAPGTPEWAAAELAAVKRMGVHEAMESFGFDPHTFGGDTPECPALAGPACTGITAMWCPRCGDCKCPTVADGLAGDMDSPDCPLHKLKSIHGEEVEC